jgi:hypothetical protein
MRATLFSLFVALLASTLSMALPLSARATPRTFAQLSISAGVSGNALAEAKAKFPGTAASLSDATISQFNVRSTFFVRQYQRSRPLNMKDRSSLCRRR